MSEPAEVAKIFMSGRSQAVRLPKSCRFDAAEVFARRVGRSVVLTPRHDDWEAAVRALFADFDADVDLKRAAEWRSKRRETLR
jgi:antitoxin VapB